MDQTDDVGSAGVGIGGRAGGFGDSQTAEFDVVRGDDGTDEIDGVRTGSYAATGLSRVKFHPKAEGYSSCSGH